MRSRIVAIALVAAALVGLAWLRCESEAPDQATAAPAAPPPATVRSVARPEPLYLHAPSGPSTFDPATQHTPDPCTSPSDAAIADDYETYTSSGVTVAWTPAPGHSLDPPLRPASIAGVTAGILDEAAALTGSERRAEIAIIIDASRDAYQARSNAPAWAEAYYDGGAIRMYRAPGEDLGVSLATLRHELMHAQLHAGVGCMPTWFNEGLAQFFAGSAPVREWFGMLRERETFDLDQMANAPMVAFGETRVSRQYARAFAMVLYLYDHGGDNALRTAAMKLRGQRRADAHALWSQLYPGVNPQAIVDALAQRVFGMQPGGELDRILAGPICCAGLRAPAELACRAGVPPAGRKRYWTDDGPPPAACSTTW